MNVRRWFCLGLVLLLAGLVPALAQSRVVRLEGWVVDEKCGKSNANEEGAGCVKDCHEEGSPLVFYAPDEDRIYPMDKQEESLRFVGKRVQVFGVVTEEGELRVGQFVELDKKDGPEEDEKSESDS